MMLKTNGTVTFFTNKSDADEIVLEKQTKDRRGYTYSVVTISPRAFIVEAHDKKGCYRGNL